MLGRKALNRLRTSLNHHIDMAVDTMGRETARVSAAAGAARALSGSAYALELAKAAEAAVGDRLQQMLDVYFAEVRVGAKIPAAQIAFEDALSDYFERAKPFAPDPTGAFGGSGNGIFLKSLDEAKERTRERAEEAWRRAQARPLSEQHPRMLAALTFMLGAIFSAAIGKLFAS